MPYRVCGLRRLPLSYRENRTWTSKIGTSNRANGSVVETTKSAQFEGAEIDTRLFPVRTSVFRVIVNFIALDVDFL